MSVYDSCLGDGLLEWVSRETERRGRSHAIRWRMVLRDSLLFNSEMGDDEVNVGADSRLVKSSSVKRERDMVSSESNMMRSITPEADQELNVIYNEILSRYLALEEHRIEMTVLGRNARPNHTPSVRPKPVFRKWRKTFHNGTLLSDAQL